MNRAQYALDSNTIHKFHDKGWIEIPGLFDTTEIEQIRLCFERLERMALSLQDTGDLEGSHFVLGSKGDKQIIKRVVWAGGSQPYLLKIGQDPRLTIPVSQLLDSLTMDQLLSQAHFKRPGDGVVFGWHQDIQHRDKGPGTWEDKNGKGSFVQTLIVVDEMTEASGALQFIPGSSQWGAVDFGEHDYDDPDSTRLPAVFDEDASVTITANPGDTLFFGPYTAHASFENKTNQYRRVFINGYAYPGANHRVYPGRGSGRRLTADRS